MFLQFVPKTHLFFTAGKDKKIKQWDADKFEHIQTLEVTLSLALSHIWGEIRSQPEAEAKAAKLETSKQSLD